MADLRYEHGREASRLLGNGIEARRTYDAGGRLSGLGYSKNGTAIAGFGFGFDPVGNLSTIQRSHEAQGDEAMQYTADHQLEDWSRGAMNATGSVVTPMDNQNWALDSRGNWTGWSHEGVSETRIHSGSNEMAERRVGVVGTLLAWDSAGNLVSDGQRTFQWNHKGQLQSIAAGMAAQGQYGYDPVGRRTVKTAGGLTTISVYDGWQCIWQKVTGSGTDTTKTFLYGNYIDEPIAMVRSWGTTSDTVWYLQGNNYNVEALTDRTGAIVERYAYTPYGEPTVYTAAGTDGKWFTSDDVTASVSAKGNALTFQGRELDAETGVYYFRNRYYSAGMGRFVSRDPLGYGAGDVNLMRFVKNGPMSGLGPDGRLQQSVSIQMGKYGVVTGTLDWKKTSNGMSGVEVRLDCLKQNCDFCETLRWQQWISTNDPVNGRSYQYLDRHPACNSPWYNGCSDNYNTSMTAPSTFHQEYGLHFYDFAKRQMIQYDGDPLSLRFASGGRVFWKAQLEIWCKPQRGGWIKLGSLQYGYQLDPSGEPSPWQ